MSLLLLVALRLKCPQNATVDNTDNLDQGLLSSTIVDNSYHQQIVLNNGILRIDQQLALDPLTKSRVAAIYSHFFDFSTRSGQAMVKLGGVQVLTSTQGEIRNSCNVINWHHEKTISNNFERKFYVTFSLFFSPFIFPFGAC